MLPTGRTSAGSCTRAGFGALSVTPNTRDGAVEAVGVFGTHGPQAADARIPTFQLALHRRVLYTGHMTSEEVREARRTLADIDAAAGSIRRTTRATSTPLLTVGLIATAVSAIQWVTQDVFTSAFLIGPITLLVLAVFGLRERRRRNRTGLSGVAGYGGAAFIGLIVGVVVVPLVFFGLAGPFLGFAIVFIAFGIRDHRPRLVAWTAALTTLGTAENYYAFTNRLPYHSWNESLHYAILVAVGVMFIGAGLFERRHEARQ